LKLPGAPPSLNLSSTDVLASLGGEDLVAWQANGYFETLLSARLGAGAPQFRSLAQEGDTVFEQPRQLNFPRWPEQLEQVGDSYVGYRVAGAAEGEVALRDVARNDVVRLAGAAVKAIVRRGSPMPVGLVNPLTSAALRDLFRYLSELGKPKP
jgi:hypothetical protein